MTGEGAAVHVVGALRDGRIVHGVRLAAGALAAEVWTYGAALRSLRVHTPQGRVETLPNPADLAAFEADTAYHARVVGRVANRIGAAAFPLDGRTVRLDANDGPNTLHGGRDGWSGRLWRFEAVEANACTLAYDSPDGEGGFPGAVAARVHVALEAPSTLMLSWEAQAGAPTAVALTHHLYFNLTGDPAATILDHTLRIAASYVTAVDAALIPTGVATPVGGTVLDLREPRPLSDFRDPAAHPLLVAGQGLDLNYVLDRGEDAVTLAAPAGGLAMHVSTDQPGCQVYAGQGLAAPLTRYGGVALEPQAIPDAVNHPAFPSVILRPGEPYSRHARYRFDAGSGPP